MYFALCIGFPVAFVLSLLTLRRTHLPQTMFVVGGVTFVVIGVMPLFIRWLGLDSLVLIGGLAFAAMLAAMLYCRREFPMLQGTPADSPETFVSIPIAVRRVLVISTACVVFAYGAWGARPNQNARLVRAVQSNDLESVQEALGSGARLDYNPFFPSRPKALGSPVTTAILSGHREMFFFLIEEGAPLDEISWQEEKTPLMAAAYMGNAEVVEFLLSRGVSVSPKFAEESSAYDFAVEQGHSEVARLLKAAAREEAK